MADRGSRGAARQHARDRAQRDIEADDGSDPGWRHRRNVGPVLDIFEDLERDILAVVPADRRADVTAYFVRMQTGLINAITAGLDDAYRAGAAGSATAGNSHAGSSPKATRVEPRIRALEDARAYINECREKGDAAPTVRNVAVAIHAAAEKAGQGYGVAVNQVARWLNKKAVDLPDGVRVHGTAAKRRAAGR